MILNVMLYKNVLGNFFGVPKFVQDTPRDFSTKLQRHLRVDFAREHGTPDFDSFYDVELYHIGTFDDETGELNVYDKPIFVFSPHEFLKSMFEGVKPEGEEN